MSDEIETIDKNPKSWAAWKREAERLQEIIDGMALAAMDSEPHTDDELSNLLWYSQEATCHSDPNYYCEFQRLETPGFIASIIRELQERRKAEQDSEPVAEITEDLGRLFVKIHHPTTLKAGDKLYRHEQPSSEREQVRIAHAEWSQATFGNVGPVGQLKHLSKEALEAAAEPDDLSEWADMQFLLWDAQRRAGITDEQITQAMIDKLAVNKQRSWPEPKDGEPRLHIKAQPAPVVPDAATAIRACLSEFPESARDIVEECADIAENACRAAMLAAAPQSPGSEPATVPGKWIPVSERMPDEAQPVIVVSEGGVVQRTVYQYCEGVWSDWYDMYDDVNVEAFTHWMPLPAAPQEVKGE